MNAIIISIGDELLIGQVVNTNASYIAEKLRVAGVDVRRMLAVGDEEQEILRALSEAAKEFELTLVTGGLGPTHDDVTRTAVCKFFETDLIIHDETLERIKALLQRRRLPWSTAAEDQARVPRGATVIPNWHGTAPGMLFDRDGKVTVVMPGVPYEMEGMVEEFLLPYFQKRGGGKAIAQKTLRTTGIGESVLAAKLGNIEDLLDGAKLAFLPAPNGVRLRITVTDSDQGTARNKVQSIEEKIRAIAEKYIYGIEDEELEDALGRILTEKKLTIAVAESCTGGMISHRLTNVPGSSNYFERGVVTYSNLSKEQILKVPKDMIEQHGAVSKEVAQAMAAGIRARAGTDIGLSTTGIAGPTGGTPEKPVGLVWIGYADKETTLALQFHFADERQRFKLRSSQAALELVRRKLLHIDLVEQPKS